MAGIRRGESDDEYMWRNKSRGEERSEYEETEEGRLPEMLTEKYKG